MAKTYGSTIGEAIGTLVEKTIFEKVKEAVTSYDATVASENVRNGFGNLHQIDLVVKDNQGNPVILIEPKYLRYTKHNWDKGSHICMTHYLIRRSIKTIRKSIAVLAESWTDNSVRFIESTGVEVYRVPFEDIVEILSNYRVDFEWRERDEAKPKRAWEAFQKLTPKQRKSIGDSLTHRIMPNILRSVKEALSGGPFKPRGIAEVELTIRTSHNEFLSAQFGNVKEAMKYLLDLQTDKEDISENF